MLDRVSKRIGHFWIVLTPFLHHLDVRYPIQRITAIRQTNARVRFYQILLKRKWALTIAWRIKNPKPEWSKGAFTPSIYVVNISIDKPHFRRGPRNIVNIIDYPRNARKMIYKYPKNALRFLRRYLFHCCK